MSRDDRRYMAGFLAHVDLNDSVKPYVEFHMMDDKTHQAIAPSALFRLSNPNDPSGNNAYNVNCSNPFLSGQQQTALNCLAADILAEIGQLDLRHSRLGARQTGRTEHQNIN